MKEYVSSKIIIAGFPGVGKSEAAKLIPGALHQHGYKTEKFVGKSEYRIDIGVIDNDNPEKYLLGILLDGKGYRTAKTTRDREIAQISVLNGLGWNILRVWSVDWWENPKKETERLIGPT